MFRVLLSLETRTFELSCSLRTREYDAAIYSQYHSSSAGKNALSSAQADPSLRLDLNH